MEVAIHQCGCEIGAVGVCTAGVARAGAGVALQLRHADHISCTKNMDQGGCMCTKVWRGDTVKIVVWSDGLFGCDYDAMRSSGQQQTA